MQDHIIKFMLPIWRGVSEQPYYETAEIQLAVNSSGFINQCTSCEIIRNTIDSYSKNEYEFITTPPGKSLWANRLGDEYYEYIHKHVHDIAGKNILEIGAGSTYIASRIMYEKCPGRYIIVDPAIDEHSVDERVVIRKEYFSADTEFDMKIECVISINTLEHVENPEEFMRHIHTLIDIEDGMVVLIFPDVEDQFRVGDFNVLLHEHLNYFTKESAELLFEKTGFEILNYKNGADTHYYLLRVNRNNIVNSVDFEKRVFAQVCKQNELLKVAAMKFARNIEYFKRVVEKEMSNSGIVVFHGATNGLNNLLYLAEISPDNKLRVYDGDESKTGKYLGNMQIMSSGNCNYKEVNKVFIAAVSFHNEIKAKLLDGSGVPIAKICSVLPELYLDKVTIKITEEKSVGYGQPCFVIAEAGVNHNGSLEIAKALVDAAVYAGADCVKFQTYKSEEVVTKHAKQADYQERNMGMCETQQEMIKKFELSYTDFSVLKDYCDEKGIMFLSTPHSESALDFLDSIVPAFKVGSGDLTNIPFLKKVALKNKPIILSTGMSDLNSIRRAVEVLKDSGNRDVILLHCITSYPCDRSDANLLVMRTLRDEFPGLAIGYSDHVLGPDAFCIAGKYGACVLEKHFTLDKNLSGPDHKASANPEELKECIWRVKNSCYEQISDENLLLGSEERVATEEELEIAKLVQKSVVANQDILVGTIITESMLTIKRPGTGMKPEQIHAVVGKTAARLILKDDLIQELDLIQTNSANN